MIKNKIDKNFSGTKFNLQNFNISCRLCGSKDIRFGNGVTFSEKTTKIKEVGFFIMCNDCDNIEDVDVIKLSE